MHKLPETKPVCNFYFILMLNQLLYTLLIFKDTKCVNENTWLQHIFIFLCHNNFTLSFHVKKEYIDICISV